MNSKGIGSIGTASTAAGFTPAINDRNASGGASLEHRKSRQLRFKPRTDSVIGMIGAVVNEDGRLMEVQRASNMNGVHTNREIVKIKDTNSRHFHRSSMSPIDSNKIEKNYDDSLRVAMTKM